ncbi:MAG: hypothetical protein ABJC89_25755 [Acidobacteriota bacterium]
MAYLTGRFSISVVLVLAAALSAACKKPPAQATAAAPLASAPAASSAPTTEAASPPRRSAAPVHVGVEMRNLLLHVSEGVVLDVRALDGEFVGQAPGEPPVFDDAASYTLRIRSADLALDAASLTNMMQQALAAHPSPLRDVHITFESGLLKAAGKLKKGVLVPFSMTAAVSVTPDGSMRLHATKLKAVGVPVKGLLDLLGLDMSSVMKMPAGSGMRADGDDLILDTAALLPPPRTEGRLRRVAVTGNRLTMSLVGPGSPPARPDTLPLPSARNYLYFFGGAVRFGKLSMTDADLQLIDADPRDPFDFFPLHYEKQLVAGYSRNTPRKGLQVFMPDYARAASNRVMLKPQRLP